MTYVDADEFLVLPDHATQIGDVIARLQRSGHQAAAASVVEMFPATLGDLAGPMPETYAGIRAAYPYFEPHSVVEVTAEGACRLTGPAKTTQLFDTYNITPEVTRRGLQRIYMSSKAKAAQSFQKVARHRTFLLQRTATSYMQGSHNANVPVAPDILLTWRITSTPQAFQTKWPRRLSGNLTPLAVPNTATSRVCWRRWRA